MSKITIELEEYQSLLADKARLDFIESKKVDVRYADMATDFVVAQYICDRYFHWSRNKALRQAIDEAKKEMKGFGND